MAPGVELAEVRPAVKQPQCAAQPSDEVLSGPSVNSAAGEKP